MVGRRLGARLTLVVGLTVGVTAAIGQEGPLDLGLVIAQQSRPSFSIIGAGARAAGMGGAFTALADDASAASFNPAGLALLIKPEVSAVLAARRLERSDTNVIGLDPANPVRYGDTNVRYDTGDVNFAAFTVPVELWRRNLCIQVSYHRLIDLEQESDRRFAGTPQFGQPVEVRQRIEQHGDIHTLSLAAAYQVTPRMSLGTSLNRWRGQWDFASLNEFRGASEAVMSYTQDTAIEGWSWNFGVLLRYPRLNVGFVYRTPYNATLAYKAGIAGSFLPPFEPLREALSLHWPSSWTAGLALKPTEWWRITVDFSRYFWSRMEIRGVEIEGANGTTRIGAVNFFDLYPSTETSTQDSGNWHFGSEVTLFAGRTPVQLRGGYFQDQQPQGMVAVEKGRQLDEAFTAGAGVKLGPFAVDFAYQRLKSARWQLQFIDPRIVVTEEPLPGQFALAHRTVREHRVLLSLLYQFSRAKTDRALRYLFLGPTED
jgi:long-subunit fatty acid transport protein